MRWYIPSAAVALTAVTALASGCLSDSEDRYLANHPGAYKVGLRGDIIDYDRATGVPYATGEGGDDAPWDWFKSDRHRH